MAAPLVTNIGSRSRRLRSLMGVVGIAVTVLLGVAFTVFDVARGARLIFFIPLLVAALGFLQARGGT